MRLQVSCCALVGGALLSLCGAAFGAGWSDDFEDGSVTDGNPVTWGQDLFGAFPGDYVVQDGDYRLSWADNGLDGDTQVTWVDSMSFTDSYIRTQGIILPGSLPEQVGGNLAILGRLDTNTVSAYILYADAGNNLGLQVSFGGAVSDLVPNVDLPFNAASEIILELNIIGDQLHGYAWQPGQPKPAEPQITATDASFASGKAGLAYQEDDDSTIGVYRYAMAQDTPFDDLPLPFPGDFNNDGVVDAADYTVWRDGSGTEEKYAEWKTNFGNVASEPASGATSVPEPGSFCLGAMSLIAAAGATARRRVA